jgi:hypothetical protein
MALNSKLKTSSLPSLASALFYGVAGLLFLALLFVSGFPPHVGLIGIVSVAAAYGLFTNQGWARYLVAALLFVGTTFALITFYFALRTDTLTAAGMIVYAVLTWVFTFFALRKPKAKTA